MGDYKKSLPSPSYNSQEFWNAAKRHKLLYQRCTRCGTRVFYPRDACPGPECLEVGTLKWVESSGKGWVYSFTIVHQPQEPAFKKDVPYIFAIIELDEGWRMTSNVIATDISSVAVGDRVEVVWDDVTDDFCLPRFRPVDR